MKQQSVVDFIEEKLDIILELHASEWDKINEVLKQAREIEDNLLQEKYGEGYGEGLYDGECK